ncbi:hypothetical protein Egran_06788 [Elaphomyces granulatus]|uniref:BHLH domain-containing protein n=1 Tax=Elaphomyces granulatus TaxID=519963 RepID=A0A232LMX2_9EURO|nr:hypothetical protein Egran_06788 [Elaphomyces granulatus]
MSRPRLPLTPSMSGELLVKDQHGVEITEPPFALPPAALSPSNGEIRPSTSVRKDSVGSYCPVSPPSPALASTSMSRTSNPPRQAGSKRTLDEFNLPPPPTRTRKIIQMKPKDSSPPKPTSSPAKPKETSKPPVTNNNNNTTTPNSKKKQPSATSAAGRKIARKTAHSLIERRRRSKMNEEFNTLKDMIPACKGQEMHKLAILQASIDYVNYLEQCIADLKVVGRSGNMASTGPPSPTGTVVLESDSGLSSSSVSPELVPSGTTAGHSSPPFSPASYAQPQEFPASILPSPALGPLQSPEAIRSTQHIWRTRPPSLTTSPAVLPQQLNPLSFTTADADIDHEASTALLMLNMDRRNTMDSSHSLPLSPLARPQPQPSISGSGSGDLKDKDKRMGMSVRDLLVS